MVFNKVNRFVHFFEWFLIKKREGFLSLKPKKKEEEEEKKEEEEEKEEKAANPNSKENKNEEKNNKEKIDANDDEYIFAAILGIYVCYYLRLDTRELRDEMNQKMSKAFGLDNFDGYCKIVVKNLIDEIKIEKGIAKNRVK